MLGQSPKVFMQGSGLKSRELKAGFSKLYFLKYSFKKIKGLSKKMSNNNTELFSGMAKGVHLCTIRGN